MAIACLRTRGTHPAWVDWWNQKDELINDCSTRVVCLWLMHNWTGASFLCVVGTLCVAAYIHKNGQDVLQCIIFISYTFIHFFLTLLGASTGFVTMVDIRDEPAALVLCRLGEKGVPGNLLLLFIISSHLIFVWSLPALKREAII